MNRIQLEKMKYELCNPYILSTDVEVNFHYHEFKNKQWIFDLDVCIGVCLDEICRSQLKLEYLIDLNGIEYKDDEEMIAMCLELIVSSLTELIFSLDTLILNGEGH